MNKNNNKNILITGSSRGIGLGIAQLLHSLGHNVFITGRNESLLEQVCQNNDFCGYFAIDLYKENSEQKLVEKTLEKLETIDVLINNAGIYIYKTIEKMTRQEIKETVRLNIEIPYLLTSLAVPKMKQQKWGRIINVGSISGVVGEGHASIYSMTKASLIGMTKALALELAEFGVTVNTINPGWVDTECINNECLLENFDKQEIIETIPQKRFVKPEEIAHMCNYLISDNANVVTGQSINICAGLSVG